MRDWSTVTVYWFSKYMYWISKFECWYRVSNTRFQSYLVSTAISFGLLCRRARNHCSAAIVWVAGGNTARTPRSRRESRLLRLLLQFLPTFPRFAFQFHFQCWASRVLIAYYNLQYLVSRFRSHHRIHRVSGSQSLFQVLQYNMMFFVERSYFAHTPHSSGSQAEHLLHLLLSLISALLQDIRYKLIIIVHTILVHTKILPLDYVLTLLLPKLPFWFVHSTYTLSCLFPRTCRAFASAWHSLLNSPWGHSWF